jgi:UDP-N-acetylglucosamine--N-acetylmuramyl-(pentapeptide) pyrophosphoryl-undecaprenol N-acetylglucosamine transferase
MGSSTPHVVFAAGGTAGHVTPALAVAESLLSRECPVRLTLAGTGKPWERELAAAAGMTYWHVPSRGWPSRFWGWPRTAAVTALGCRAAFQLARTARPDLVVGCGGHSSAALVALAARLRIPLVLFEQNAVPGRVNRMASRAAAVVGVAFAEAMPQFPRRDNVRLVGTPTRARPVEPKRTAHRLLVLGGSQGARSLNEDVPLALAGMKDLLAEWEIVHQAGAGNEAAVRARYWAAGLSAHVAGFDPDLSRFFNADLAISRAGGSTLAELGRAGVPSIVVPYPSASDDHQRKNARALAAIGACRIVDPSSDGGQSLSGALRANLVDLASNGRLRYDMSAAFRRWARPDAARRVADEILNLLHADVRLSAGSGRN